MLAALVFGLSGSNPDAVQRGFQDERGSPAEADAASSRERSKGRRDAGTVSGEGGLALPVVPEAGFEVDSDRPSALGRESKHRRPGKILKSPSPHSTDKPPPHFQKPPSWDW
jgi:hypothetical protein